MIPGLNTRLNIYTLEVIVGYLSLLNETRAVVMNERYGMLM